MRVGIMQPYFFPYLGHFALIAQTDVWVVFDITQYTPKSFMTRNDVLKLNGGRQRVGVDLKNGSIHIKTHEARLMSRSKARQQLMGAISHYKRKAPYFQAVCDVVEATFEELERSAEPDSLVNLNTAGLGQVCAYLGLAFDCRVASQMDMKLPETMGAGDWAPTIAKQVGASTYLNPIGGRALFNPEQFRQMGVNLEFLDFKALTYATPGYAFEPNLSILDVMMWNSPQAIEAHLKAQNRVAGT